MGIDADLAFGCLFYRAQVLTHHVLAVVPFVMRHPVIDQLDISGIRHVAGFHLANAHGFVKIKRGFHLAGIIHRIAGSLMVPDQPHTFLAAVVCYRLDIEIRIGFRKTEQVTVVEPFAIPAGVPPLDQHAIEAVLRGEIDIALGFFRRRTVFGPGAPRPFPDVHRPPDTHVLARLHPGHVAQDVGLVQVQDQV